MGGAKDSILPTTHKVILEVANFNAAGVRRTALWYDNRTGRPPPAMKRPSTPSCDQALELAAELFRQLYPEVQFTALWTTTPPPWPARSWTWLSAGWNAVWASL